MKVRLNRAELGEALATICSVTPARSPKPVLGCTLLEVFEDHCHLTATDMEVGLRVVLNQVEVEEPNCVLVSAGKLAQIVRESTASTLELESVESVCHIRGKGSHFQIYCQEPRDFPPVAEMPPEADFEAKAEVLRGLSEWTVLAAAKESTRYAINGVLWECAKASLGMVGTDGRRLARAVGEVQRLGSDADLQAIVPSKALHLFQRVLGSGEDRVAVKVMENQIMLGLPRATITATLLEGKFPKYEDVIPSDCDKTIELPTDEFLSAVRQAALLTNEESKGIRFSLSKDNLTLSSRVADQGEATISLDVAYRGESVEVGFNPVFLIDVLRVVPTDTVKFDLKDARRPGVLHSGPDLLYVVMPVNLS